MSTGDVDEQSIILRPRSAGALAERLSRPASIQKTRRQLFASGKYRGAKKCPRGEGMTFLDQCDHADIELSEMTGEGGLGRWRG